MVKHINSPLSPF